MAPPIGARRPARGGRKLLPAAKAQTSWQRFRSQLGKNLERERAADEEVRWTLQRSRPTQSDAASASTRLPSLIETKRDGTTTSSAEANSRTSWPSCANQFGKVPICQQAELETHSQSCQIQVARNSYCATWRRRPVDARRPIRTRRRTETRQLFLVCATLIVYLLATSATGLAYQLANNLIANNSPPKFVQSGAGGQQQASSASAQGSSEIVVRVREGPQSVGKLIYTLRAEDLDDDPLTFGVLGSMANELLRVENVPGNSANVYLRKELDRETTESHQVVITLTDGKLGRGNWITKSMLVIVEDVNDNRPLFGPHKSAINVREDAKAPLVIETIEATDADEGRFGQVVYRLEEVHSDGAQQQPQQQQAAAMFSIETLDGKGVISLVGQLDFEQRQLYQLRVIAVDRAAEAERLSASVSILVSVDDCEDQPPMFTFAPSITRVPENLPVGSNLVRVVAVDGDRGVGKPIRYALESVNGQQSGTNEHELFSIGADSGQIRVARKLDRELATAPAAGATASTGTRSGAQPGAYVLQVRASELNSPESFATTELTVILTDVNDEAPTFSQAAFFGELFENSAAESLVGFVPAATAATAAANGQPPTEQVIARVFDRDQGTNGTFSLHLEGEHAHLFDVWPREATNEAQLMVKVAAGQGAGGNLAKYLDFERTRELHLTIVAREKVPSGGKRVSSSVPMTIYVRDTNDNYPQFESELYRVEIPENAIRGMHVCAVKATDLDSNSFGTQGIRYTEIRGEKANKFKLDPISGIVTLKTNEHGFDRETINQHHLIVEARDNNGLGNRNTTQLLIVLTDANDQRPKFLLDKYEAFIYENELDFQSPLQVQAIDNDAPNTLNSKITYSIVGGDPQQNFTIEPQTGRIRVRTSLSIPPPQSLRVSDESDILIEDERIGLANSTATGQAGLDFERIAQKHDDTRLFNLTIRATDSGLPEQLSDTTQVIVLVYDKNDHAPVFTRSVYSKSIREDAKEGSQVVQVVAHDGDHSPTNSKVTYRISSGASDKFVIDSDTGLISVAAGASLDIDRVSAAAATGSQAQKRTSYLLNVLAFDGSFGPNQKSSSCLVDITILDVNNKAPEFVSLGGSQATRSSILAPGGGGGGSSAAAAVQISEDAPFGLVVTRIVATDLDSNAELRYSINYARSEARNDDGAQVEPSLFRDVFSIEPSDGTIKVAKQLDRELFDQVKLRVQVEDVAAQTSDQVAHTYLLVKITDVNDNRPTFKRPAYKAIVNENSVSGTSVITLAADDRDLNKTLRYSLEAPSSELNRLVRINPRSGEVTVNDKIDRETFSQVNLTVKAEDFGFPHSLTGTTQLLITVRDENDNNPIFMNSTRLGSRVSAAAAAAASANPLARSDPDGGESPPSEPNTATRNHNMNAAPTSFRSRSLSSRGGPAYNAAAGDAGEPILELLDEGGPPSEYDEELALLAAKLPLLAPGSTVQVREDAPIGQQVAFVRAEDADLNNNGRVTYLLEPSSSNGKFRIDRDSGIISVAAELDRESQRHFTLIIEACDNFDLGYSTGESRRAFTQVYVQITDINDNTPIVLSPQQADTNRMVSSSGNSLFHSKHVTIEEAMNSAGPYEVALSECVFISEFQPLNEPIMTLVATDADDPETQNGKIDLAIVNNFAQNELFSLLPLIKSTATGFSAPEAEGNATSKPPPTTTASSLVADLSGFGESLADLVPAETSRESRQLVAGRSSQAAEAAKSKRFRREVDATSELVQTDGGNFYSAAGRQFSSAPRGTAPKQSNLRQSGRSVHPNQQLGAESLTVAPTTVETASANLPPPPSTATSGGSVAATVATTILRNQLQAGGQTKPNGGVYQAQVVVAQSLKEKVGNYTILIRATDRGQPSLSSLKMVNICVQDVNNHAPIFTRPPLNHTIRIMENATIGSYVTQVEATDLDFGLNKELQYLLRPTNIQNSNNDWQSFRIDRVSGIISTARLFNRQLKKYYTLRVEAQDFGKPTSLSSNIDINIMIVNSGKYQPEFEQQQQQVQFTENVSPGAEWFTLLQTTNLDDDPALIEANNLLGGGGGATAERHATNWHSSPCYYIVDGDDFDQVFHLDRYSHRLTNQKQIDRERKSNYTLLVQASNNCSKQPAALPSKPSNSELADEPASLRRKTRSAAAPDSQTTRKQAAPANRADQPPPPPPKAEPQTAGLSVEQFSSSLEARLASDKSLLQVNIRIKDVNDNAPKFTQRVYTGGITTEADFGTVFMIAQASDADADTNGQVAYSILKPIKRNLVVGPTWPAATTTTAPTTTTSSSGQSEQSTSSPTANTTGRNKRDLAKRTAVRSLGGEPAPSESENGNLVGGPNELAGDGDELFVINAQTGEISLNFDPQKHMKGYFEFEIVARDIDGLSDSAKVFIYLLRQDQRVKFVLRLAPQELRQRLNKFRSVFGNITGAIVNIDSYKYFENSDGTVDKKKTSLYLHFVNPEDNTIIDVDKVLTLIDNNIEYLDELYKEFHVLSSEAAQLALSSDALVDPIDQVRTGLMGVSSFLALILVLVIALCLNQRSRYERQLKAATVSAFGGSPLGFGASGGLDDDYAQTNLPNTNLHSQDPNPIWASGYGEQAATNWLGGAETCAAKKRPHSRMSPSDGHAIKTKGAAHKHLHSASSGIGVTIEDDEEDQLSSASSGQLDLGSLNGVVGNSGGGQSLHYNVATTATPRDSLTSSHGQVSSSGSGSGSASTTNERQALCGNGASRVANPNARQQVTANTETLSRRRTSDKNAIQQQRSHLNTGGSAANGSTFGAYKEVTIYTDQRQVPAAAAATYAQPIKSAATNKQANKSNYLVREVSQQAAQFGAAGKPVYLGQQQASVTVAGKQPQHQQHQKQRILIHANGADVSQGIIRAAEGKQVNLGAKFVPGDQQQQSVGGANQKARQQESAVKNFETSMSKLSILNLETTEL